MARSSENKTSEPLTPPPTDFSGEISRLQGEIAVLRQEAENQRNESAQVTIRHAAEIERSGGELREGQETTRQARLAALNLMEDAIAAREVAEQALRRAEEEAASRAQAEAASLVSERRYQSLFESIDEGFCVIEVIFDEHDKAVDYRFLEMNPAFERHTGIKDGGGRRIREIAPQHEEFWFETYGCVALTGEPTRFEHAVKHLDQYRYYDVHASRVGKPHERRVGVLFSDISEHKRAEDDLRASEERFRMFVTASSEIVYRMNADWSEMLSLDGKSILADTDDRSGRWFVQYIPDSEKPAVQVAIAEAIRTKTKFEMEHRVIRADGTIGWAFSRAVPFLNERGEIIEWFGAASDITDHRHAETRLAAAEERLRILVDSALEHAIIALNPARIVTNWNPGAEEIFGYSAQEAIGQSADIIFTEEARAEDVPGQEMRTALEKGRANDDRWMRRKDGSRFWANGAMFPMRATRDGEVLGFVKILQDETETQQAREALEASREELWQALQETERARDEAEAAGRAKDHFLAVLSHELRTPLTPVMLAVELIEGACGKSAMISDALEMIRRNIGIEARSIGDLLDVTRIGHGKFQITPAQLDLHEVIRRAVIIVQPDCAEKDQHLDVSLAATESMVSGDDIRLEQVACNLLKNASKFTPEDGQIVIRTYNEAAHVIVEVADTGIGIAATELPAIFDAFAQANQSISQQFGGLGLGLAIAKAIVDGHGGELRARSRGLGHGATFVVRLPLLRENAKPAAKSAPARRARRDTGDRTV